MTQSYREPQHTDDGSAPAEPEFLWYRFADRSVERSFRAATVALDRRVVTRWGMAIGVAFASFLLIDPWAEDQALDLPRVAVRSGGLVLAMLAWALTRRVRDPWILDVWAATVFVLSYGLFAVSEHQFPSTNGDALTYHVLFVVALLLLFGGGGGGGGLGGGGGGVFLGVLGASPPPTTVGMPGIVAPNLVAFGFSLFASAALHRARRREWFARTHLERVLRHKVEIARTDPLTGALNRRGFVERARAECDRQEREQGRCGLMLLDLDHFKRVNDEHQHHELLAAPSPDHIIATDRREHDAHKCPQRQVAGLVTMPGLGALEMRDVAERVRLDVHGITLPGGRDHLTVSIGVTAVDTRDDLLVAVERADRAMYEAKRAGRDAVVVSSQVT